jgi:hypothetical protein
MNAKREELAEALDGMFDDHHGELVGVLLDQIGFLDERIMARSGSRTPPYAMALTSLFARRVGVVDVSVGFVVIALR